MIVYVCTPSGDTLDESGYTLDESIDSIPRDLLLDLDHGIVELLNSL